MTHALETMQPDPDWTSDDHPDVVEAFGRDGLTFRVWGGDWCGDCQRLLPALGAALAAAGVPDERVHEYPVEKDEDGTKVGPEVEAYGVEYIPTVVVERDGEEVARFVEAEGEPVPTYLARRLAELPA
jgi:thiol-disulfide isomerase/thioredoxin